ncbi:Alanine dehydrogenase [Pedococcus cremeus]|uniref:Alanine dehydrogenase n=1 Tax=Pedococcus cremeus TaxID=587636 RepID=A0A1H9TKH1_9MICO|nr:N(5)-(carboxyethyl)ornithine synthase [Pedococcus cremeus]SER97691.1 Alanine dehydrogenase [Pedococcus cremeus]
MTAADGTRQQHLTLGVMARSQKENERRLPIHPHHLPRVAADLRERIVLEEGYGERFGVTDDALRELVGAVRPRAEVIESCDVVLQPKPVLSDLAEMRFGQIFWGWPHCVQDEKLTQLAIDKHLTLIAFEAMNHWNRDGSFNLHVFHKNNEMAGYCSVLHALQLAGVTGDFGRKLRAAVIGFGATARGAVSALNGLGIFDVDVLTHREVAAVAAPIHTARIVHFDDRTEERMSHAVTERGPVPLAGFLAEHDVVVNCVLQDTDRPAVFMSEDDLPGVRRGTVVVDVSCDEGMGFSWARPTSFADPVFEVGDGVLYYAVDHSPSYLWSSATWEISEALLPFVRTVLDGPEAWEEHPTVRRAIEIRDGVIQNAAILSFQGRSPVHPHYPLAT